MRGRQDMSCVVSCNPWVEHHPYPTKSYHPCKASGPCNNSSRRYIKHRSQRNPLRRPLASVSLQRPRSDKCYQGSLCRASLAQDGVVHETAPLLGVQKDLALGRMRRVHAETVKVKHALNDSVPSNCTHSNQTTPHRND